MVTMINKRTERESSQFGSSRECIAEVNAGNVQCNTAKSVEQAASSLGSWTSFVTMLLWVLQVAEILHEYSYFKLDATCKSGYWVASKGPSLMILAPEPNVTLLLLFRQKTHINYSFIFNVM